MHDHIGNIIEVFAISVLVLITVLAFMLAGCATISTEFVDADGTGFEAKSVGVFAAAKTDNQSLHYSLNEDGTWDINVGQQAVNSDATATVELLNNTLPMLITALARVPSGGGGDDGGEDESGMTLAERLARLEEFWNRVRPLLDRLDRNNPAPPPILIPR